MKNEEIVILVGSMSGTADLVADEVALKLKSMDIKHRVVGMQKGSLAMLSKRSYFIICVSTSGKGDMPDNGQAFYDLLLNERPDISHIRYGVIALGDMTYSASFCGAGVKLDKIFAELGAKPIVERMEHDSKSGVFPEDMALDWLEGWIQASEIMASSEIK